MKTKVRVAFVLASFLTATGAQAQSCDWIMSQAVKINTDIEAFNGSGDLSAQCRAAKKLRANINSFIKKYGSMVEQCGIAGSELYKLDQAFPAADIKANCG